MTLGATVVDRYPPDRCFIVVAEPAIVDAARESAFSAKDYVLISGWYRFQETTAGGPLSQTIATPQWIPRSLNQ